MAARPAFPTSPAPRCSHPRPPTRASAGLAALALLCVAAGLPGCGRGGGGPAKGDTLYIAVAAPSNATGQPYIDGVRFAIQDLNRRRPRGRPPLGLRLPPPDQPSQVAIATGFRDDPSIIGVVGHTGSAQTMDAAPIYGDVEGDGRRAVVAITPTATNPAVTAQNRWIFRICPTDHDVARALARFARDSLGAARAAVVYRNDVFGRGFQRVFGRSFEDRGGTVEERDPYLSGITEFPAYAARMAGRGVDALIIAGGASDARDIIAAVRGAGLNLPVLGTDDLAALASDSGAAQGTRGLWYAAFFLASDRTSRLGRVFVARFDRAFGYQPDHRAALSYDAATLLGEAVFAVGGDRRAIRDWLARPAGPDRPAFQGVTGPIRFGVDRNVQDKRILIGRISP